MIHKDDITDWIHGVYFEITDEYVDVLTTYVAYSMNRVADDVPMAVARMIAGYVYLMDEEFPDGLTVGEFERCIKDLVCCDLSNFIKEDEQKSIVYDHVENRHVCKCVRCLRPMGYGPTRHIARENAYKSEVFGTSIFLKGKLCKMCVQEVFPRLLK